MDVASWTSPAFWVGSACAVLVAGNLASIAVAWVRMRRRPAAAPRVGEGVSIVRPVCGLETFSEETLRSGFRLDHASYEMILCVANPHDPIVPLVERLIAAHPRVPARLIVGDEPFSDNPKLNNCVRGWEAARHEWVVLADSNVMMPPDYIGRLMAGWRRSTGLVCSTPAGARPQGFWAEVECAFLNSLQARWQYAGEALGFGFAQGKSMLWRKEFLDEKGGIRALAAEIAEDAAATKLVRAAGCSVHLVDMPFEQPLGRRGAREVWSRQLRWARLRRVTFPVFFAPELFSGPVVPALMAAYGAPAFGLGASAAVALLLGLWWGTETVFARRKGWPTSWRLPIVFAIRDLMILPMWTAAWIAEDIVWRGTPMTIRTKAAAAQVSVDGAAV